MDIQLHGISGFDIIKEIKADDKINEIPIVAVTAFAMKDDKAKIMESGCAEYISKPISIDGFLKTVKEFAKV
jgi:two-component system cell cycle response regulator DivK